MMSSLEWKTNQTRQSTRINKKVCHTTNSSQIIKVFQKQSRYSSKTSKLGVWLGPNDQHWTFSVNVASEISKILRLQGFWQFF